MATDRLQALLDGLVAEIGSGATIEDLDGRAIAYSAQPGPVDEARISAILTRETPPDVYAWQQSHGIATATGPVRIPANPELGMLPRLCVPLRHRGVRLGHLWIIESERPLTDADVAAASRTARSLAALVYRDRSPALAARSERAALLARGLGGDRRAGVRNLRRLVEEHELPARAPVRMLALAPVGADEAAREEALAPIQVALADRFVSRASERLAAVVGAHVAVLVVEPPDGPRALTVDAAALELAGRLRDDALAALGPGETAVDVVVGISDAHDELADARTAHEQAVGAARAAAADPALAPVAAWSGIGVYRLLLGDGPGALDPGVASPALARLDGRDADMLRETLETYLDLGANVQRTAAALHLHRTSLYHRLGRIEERTGVDLASGPARLELHVALKLARLAGAPAV